MTVIPPAAAGEHLGGSTRRGSLVVAGPALDEIVLVLLAWLAARWGRRLAVR